MQHLGQIAMAVLVVALAAGCSGSASFSPTGASSSSAKSAAGKTCGTLQSAAHVPVKVEVSEGSVDCALALRVQADYTRKLAAGEAPGNGGGGPVPVDGWTCEGYPTPQVMQTGRASQCRRGGAGFVAVLPSPNAPQKTSATP